MTAGWFLLPRTRQRAAARASIRWADPAGRGRHRDAGRRVAVSGLGLPLLGLAGARPWRCWPGGPGGWERRAAAPLVDLTMLAAIGTWPLLARALCAYLVLFGPLG